MITAQYHDNRSSPVAHWLFNGDLTDSSGNGFDLSLENGTARYCEMAPGLRGFYFDGASNLNRAFAAALAITGDLTIKMLFQSQAHTVLASIIAHGVQGETEATNSLYWTQITAARNLVTIHESGAGSNSTHTINDVIDNGALHHFAIRRASGVYQYFVDGVPFGAASSAFTAPTGGGSGALYVGGDPFFGATTNFLNSAAIASLMINNVAETNDAIKLAHNRTLGPLLGIV